jgi:uncharacterized repeat protein (TIGR01451 family)
VCIYAPRFGVVRRVVNLMSHERLEFVGAFLDEMVPVKAQEENDPRELIQRHAVAVNLGPQRASLLRERQQPGEFVRLEGLVDVKSTLAPYADLCVVRTGVFENKEKPWLATAIDSAITWTGDQAAQVVLDNRQAVALVRPQQPGVVYELGEPHLPKLRLIKLASTGNAQPGQIVEFTLRFDNVGDVEIGNVTILDNLTTRLEYVEGTAKSSVAADFSTQPNEHGSKVLRWEIQEPLQPGDGGILQFQCKVL